MKDLVIGVLLGFSAGVVSYFLVDGTLNKAARAASVQQQRELQTQLDMLQKMCPEVLQKVQSKK